MKSVKNIAWCVVLAWAVVVSEPALAKRLGGGRDLGRKPPAGMLQRSEAPVPARSAPEPGRGAPAPAAAPAAGASSANAAPRSGAARWLGPLAGVLAGAGLAAWLADAGWGGGLLTALVMLALGGALLAWGLGRARQAQRARAAYATPYAHTGLGPEAAMPYLAPAPTLGSAGLRTGAEPDAKAMAASSSPAEARPAGWDEAGFLRQAKSVFMRLQGAFDAGDCADLAEFTRPELYAELEQEVAARAGRANQTDVMTLDAAILSVATVDQEQWASVRFRGLVREHPAEHAGPIDEVWHFMRPLQGAGGWVLGGLEQVTQV